MCRDNDHGGRRCPHDTSEARRLRRHNATAKSTYSEQLHPKFISATDVTYSIEEITGPTIETVKVSIAELDDLREQHKALDLGGYTKKEFFTTINGEEQVWDTRHQAIQALLVAQEQKVVEIGGQVEAIADQRTGISELAVREYTETRGKELNDAIDALQNDPVYSEQYNASLKITTGIVDEIVAKYGQPDGEDHSMKMPDLIYTLRYKYAPDDEGVREVLARYDESKKNSQNFAQARYDLLFALRQEASQLLGTGSQHPEILKLVKAKADSYKEVLGEIRPLGGELKVTDTSHKAKLAVLNSVLDIYPTDWIEASNEGNDLRIKITAGRAHYSSRAYQNVKKNRTHRRMVEMPIGFVPDPTNPEEMDMIKVEGDEWTDEIGHKYTSYYGLEEGKEYWMKPQWQQFYPGSFRSKNGVPAGPGWREIQVSTYVGRNEDGTSNYEMKTGWQKPIISRETVESVATAEITIGGNDASIYSGGVKGSTGHATAIHEFAHRVEATDKTGFIPKMEERFLQRRTTDASGEREKLVRLYRGKKELARPDNFPSAYMGKIYDDLHREVLSMGAEAIFSGRHGALQGGGSTPQDPDMRKFILGLFAAA
jgi:hypothetical protein